MDLNTSKENEADELKPKQDRKRQRVYFYIPNNILCLDKVHNGGEVLLFLYRPSR